MTLLLLRRVADWLERHSLLGLALFSLVFLGVSSLIGETKLMNFDELFTYYPAGQATLSDVWSFYAEGIDTNTPVAALLVRASLKIFGDNHLALRLPMIFGYWLMCICIYAFVAHRCSRIYGMAAMLLPPVTSVYFYATEARSYGVLLGVSALALVAWQRAADGERRWLWLPILALSLGLCISLHYMTVFLLVPLGVAELVRWWQRKKLDWGMALVLVLSLSPLAVLFPLLLRAKANYLNGFWARPGLGDIENSYRSMLTLAFAPLLGLVVAWLVISRKQPSSNEEPFAARTPLAERVMIATLALAPFYVVPAMLVGGTFVARYVLYCLIGITILLANAIYEKARGNALLAMVAIGVLGGWFLLKYPSAGRRQRAENPGLPSAAAKPLESKMWMQVIEQQPDLPVVINPAVFYLPFRHYSLPSVQSRTYYLTSTADAMRLDGTDTGDRSLILFGRRFPMQVPPYAEFVAAHREFLLLAETTNPTWVMEKLLADKAELKLMMRDQTYFLFHVSLPAPF